MDPRRQLPLPGQAAGGSSTTAVSSAIKDGRLIYPTARETGLQGNHGSVRTVLQGPEG